MKNKLNLDASLIYKARSAAGDICDNIQQFIDKHTTVTVERTVARLFSIDGIDSDGTPSPILLYRTLKRRIVWMPVPPAIWRTL